MRLLEDGRKMERFTAEEERSWKRIEYLERKSQARCCDGEGKILPGEIALQFLLQVLMETSSYC